MTLAITFNDEDRVLEITGAYVPTITNKYTSNFATDDSWTADADDGYFGGTLVSNKSNYHGTDKYAESGVIFNYQFMERSITGLTAGNTYRVRTELLYRSFDPAHYCDFYYQVADVGNSAITRIQGPWSPTTSDWVEVEHTFVATATSHELRLRRNDNRTSTSDDLFVYNVRVDQIPTGGYDVGIQRTDVNGTHWVRASDLTPDSSGNLNVVDPDMSSMGIVSWTVRDGDGNMDTETFDMGSGGEGVLYGIDSDDNKGVIDDAGSNYGAYSWYLNSITASRDYQESENASQRADNASIDKGTYAWTRRKGTMVFRLGDSDYAHLVRDFVMDNTILMLKQSTHEGLDMWFTAKRVTVTPTSWVNGDDFPDDGHDRWIYDVEIEYEEVDWPTRPSA